MPPPLASVLAVPLRGFEGIFSDFGDRRSAFEDNQKLREEIAMLRERQARYDNLANKVARYEAILGVDTETGIPLRKIAGRAIGETAHRVRISRDKSTTATMTACTSRPLRRQLGWWDARPRDLHITS